MVDVADCSLELQRATISHLRADAGVAAIVAGRVFDATDPAKPKPYVSLGPAQVIPEKAQDYDGSDISFQVDAWTEGPESVQVKQLGAAIRAALDQAELSLTGFRIVDIFCDATQYLREPDGLTQHAALTFRARTEPTD